MRVYLRCRVLLGYHARRRAEGGWPVDRLRPAGLLSTPMRSCYARPEHGRLRPMHGFEAGDVLLPRSCRGRRRAQPLEMRYLRQRGSGPSDGPGREFIIQELRCEGATVAMSSNLVPSSGVKVEVAPFTMTEISNSQPISTADLSAVFIRSLIRQTLSTKGLLRPIADLLRGEDETAGSNVTLIEEPEPQLRE